jgi:hypothetical protein
MPHPGTTVPANAAAAAATAAATVAAAATAAAAAATGTAKKDRPGVFCSGGAQAAPKSQVVVHCSLINCSASPLMLPPLPLPPPPLLLLLLAGLQLQAALVPQVRPTAAFNRSSSALPAQSACTLPLR